MRERATLYMRLPARVYIYARPPSLFRAYSSVSAQLGDLALFVWSHFVTALTARR